MIEIPEHIKDIMGKKMLNREAHSDLVELQAWRDLCAGNDDEYGRMMQLWSEAGAVLDKPTYNVKGAWIALDDRLRAVSHPPVEKDEAPLLKPSLGYSFIRVAAAAAVVTVLLAGWWVIHINTRSNIFLRADATMENKTLSLPDGSVVVLRKGSSIRYPSDFDRKERVVRLTGEAFFSVRPQPEQPFFVQTERSVVRVLGTSFLISTGSISDRVVVATGKVLFSSKTEPEQQCTLSEEQEAVLTKKGFEQGTLQDSNYLSWQTGMLKFTATPIDRVAKELSGYYGIAVRLDDSLVSRSQVYTVTGSFNCRLQPLEEVLDEIAAFARLRYQREKDMITISQL